MHIEGISRYENLEGGFWIIEGDNGRKFFPINMPEQLKTPGARVSITATILKDAFTIGMMGDPIRITGFSTIG